MENPWPHRSSEDLATAGYKCRDAITCPYCDCKLWIYQQEGCMPVFLNSHDYWPHLIVKHNEEAPPTPEIDHKSAAAGER